jgi:hypothetical protein
MKKLDVVKYEFREGKMIMVWHRYNTEDSNNDCSGTWFALRELNKAEVAEFARMHTDPDIECTVL